MKRMTTKDFLEVIQNRGIPTDLVSPGHAAVTLGISRQALRERLDRGTLTGWILDDGVIFVDVRDVKFAKAEKLAIERARKERERKRNATGVGTM